MKYLFIILSIFITGCATVSDYNRGCRDGLMGLNLSPEGVNSVSNDQKNVDKYCDRLETAHKSSERVDQNMGRK